MSAAPAPEQLAAAYHRIEHDDVRCGVLFAHGEHFTGRLDLADVRVAAADARFAQMEINRGICAFGGATIRLPRDAGWGNAMRWLLTGEAYDDGLEGLRSFVERRPARFAGR